MEQDMNTTEIKKAVRDGYGNIATRNDGCGCGCACGTATPSTEEASRAVGYTSDQMESVPEGANLGLGCGNPTGLASLQPGETVLDLGSGAGFDCFLAANQVGETGRVIGVDMTPEMLDKARHNAVESGRTNVEFRLGEIEHLPVADNIIDAIISNCVINLAPDKEQVFREAYRTLKPGGRVMLSDVVLTAPITAGLRGNLPAYIGCIAGAIPVENYEDGLRRAGFHSVEVLNKNADQTRIWAEGYLTQEILDELGLTLDEALAFADTVVSVTITAIK